jgi:hypothetical protein
LTLANQEDLEEEQEGEMEVSRVRKAMERMSPKERELYEKFLREFWPKVLDDLKKERKDK